MTAGHEYAEAKILISEKTYWLRAVSKSLLVDF